MMIIELFCALRTILPRLEDKDDLIAQIVPKYGVQKAPDKFDEDALFKGRQIWRPTAA